MFSSQSSESSSSSSSLLATIPCSGGLFNCKNKVASGARLCENCVKDLNTNPNIEDQQIILKKRSCIILNGHELNDPELSKLWQDPTVQIFMRPKGDASTFWIGSTSSEFFSPQQLFNNSYQAIILYQNDSQIFKESSFDSKKCTVTMRLARKISPDGKHVDYVLFETGERDPKLSNERIADAKVETVSNESIDFVKGQGRNKILFDQFKHMIDQLKAYAKDLEEMNQYRKSLEEHEPAYRQAAKQAAIELAYLFHNFRNEDKDISENHSNHLEEKSNTSLSLSSSNDSFAGYRLIIKKSATRCVLTYFSDDPILARKIAYSPSNQSSKTTREQREKNFEIIAGDFIGDYRGFNYFKIVRPFISQNRTGFFQPKIINSAHTAMFHQAFKQHLAVAVTPDDLHLLFIQAIANFYKTYPEDLRQTAVSFDEKKRLVVDNDHVVPGCNPRLWDYVPLQFSEALKKELPAKVCDLLLMEFSQTTDTERLVKAVTLMGTFSAYFDHGLLTKCAIPQFILEGSEDDWKKLSTLPEELIKALNLPPLTENKPHHGLYLLRLWLERISPLLKECYQARCGQASAEWWASFYSHKMNSGEISERLTGNLALFYPLIASQDPRHEKMVLNPWIMDLTSVKLGKEGPLFNQIPTNITRAPFVHKVLSELYDAEMLAGIPSYTMDSSKSPPVLRTYVDFTIFYKARREIKSSSANDGKNELAPSLSPT